MNQTAGCPVPNGDSQKKAEQVGNPQVPLTDPKHQIQPEPAEGQKKQAIAADGKTGTQRPEKTIPQPQDNPQKTADGKPLEGNGWDRHANSRRQPPGRGSS